MKTQIMNKIQKISLPVKLVLISFLFASCATIFFGARQNVSLYSNPPGASVFINGQDMNRTTPCNITVNRKVAPSQYNGKNEYCYIFKKDGYQDTYYCDKSRFNWVTAIDLIYYLVPGLIDFAVGADRVYSSSINATLIPLMPQSGNTTVSMMTPKTTSPQPPAATQEPAQSDVDKDIPVTGVTYENRFALIIGNEDYASQQPDMTSEVNVQFARNDATAFKEYAVKVMGIPEENITFLLDATIGKMKQGLDKMNKLAKNTMGNAELVFYYAGHGMPDEVNKEPYLIPVDVSGNNVKEGVSLAEVYQKLTEYPCKRVTVFLDACFSGGARNLGLIAARGVKVKPKQSNLSGNMVVFTASSEDQASMAYKAKAHGMFTYYLLTKLKETKGDVTYKELSDYLSYQVGVKSVSINQKEQNPQTNVSQSLGENWKNWKFK